MCVTKSPQCERFCVAERVSRIRLSTDSTVLFALAALRPLGSPHAAPPVPHPLFPEKWESALGGDHRLQGMRACSEELSHANVREYG